MVRKSKNNIEEYKGKTINSWTVLHFDSISSKHEQYWFCRCKCGIEKSIRASHIIRELSKNCHSCRTQAARGINSPHWKGNSFISQSILTSIKACATKRKIEVLVDIEDLDSLDCQGSCPIK